MSFSKATFVSRRTSVLKPIKNSLNETKKMNPTRLPLRAQERKKKNAAILNTDIMCINILPFLVKKSLEYLPAIMSLRGTLPSSSMISAIWSTMGGGGVRGACQGGGGGEKTNETHQQRVVRRAFRHGPRLGVHQEGGGFSHQRTQEPHQLRPSLQVSGSKIGHQTLSGNNHEDIQFYVLQCLIYSAKVFLSTFKFEQVCGRLASPLVKSC